MIVTYEPGGDSFWLARWLQQHGMKIYVMSRGQSSRADV